MRSASLAARVTEPVRRAVELSRRNSRRVVAWLLRTPSRSVWASAVAGFVLSSMMSVLAGFPPPHVNDEFSYLLAGDTFANGHLSYPTHPMWRHFETFHVLQVPSYASKYPPAQGAVLALGQRLFGTPIAGVWLSCALFIAAVNWMLKAWTRPSWALYGALAAALWLCGRHARAAYWATSFWGGSVTALGAALLFGGMRRLSRTPGIGASLAAGCGVAIIANSRPYEGLFFVVVPAGVILWVLVREARWKRMTNVLRVAAPMSLVVAATGAFMGFYNSRITGSATRPPYLEYEKQYASSPALLGQAAPSTPSYRNAVMEQFYSRGGSGATRHRADWRSHIRYLRDQSGETVRFYLPWFAGPLLFVIPWVPNIGWTAVALASVALTVFGASLSLFALQPHYVAPIAAAWCVVLTYAARFMSQMRWQRLRVGRGIVGLIVICLCLSVMTEVGAGMYRRQHRDSSWSWQRQAIERQLAESGMHLILVEYGPSHDPDAEWVYNRADIDAAKVVWARSLGESENAELRRYFAGRAVWQLVVQEDTGPFVLRPIAAGSTPQPQRQ